MPRVTKPWYRAERKQWFAYIRGRQRPLGIADPEDQAGAEVAYQRLMVEGDAPLAQSSKPDGDGIEQLAALIASKIPPADLDLDKLADAIEQRIELPNIHALAEIVASKVQSNGLPAEVLAALAEVVVQRQAPAALEPFQALQQAARACGRIVSPDATVARVVLLDANGKNLVDVHVPG